MGYIGPLLVIVGALVALSGFIISKKPDLKATFDKLGPYTGFLGVALLGYGLYDLYYNMFASFWGSQSRFGFLFSGPEFMGQHGPSDKFSAILLLGVVLSEILLGFMLGFGLIATWIPGESGAEKKAVAIQKKLLALATPIGVVGLICAVLWIIKGGPGMHIPALG